MSDTQSHIRASKQLHKDNSLYGPADSWFQDTNIKRLFGIPYGIKKVNEYSNIKSVLDYGCGKGGLVLALKKTLCSDISIRGFDPGIEEYSTMPKEKFDIITCVDVLEHIDRHAIDAVLNQIKNSMTGFMVFIIDLIPAIKSLADGRNAHILLAPPEYWASKINQAFDYSICFNVGELKNGEKYPTRFIGCCCNDYKYYDAMNVFIKESNFGNMRLIMVGGGVVEWSMMRKDYKKLT